MNCIEKQCPICGKDYQVPLARHKQGKGTACGRACSYILRGQKNKIKQIKITTEEFVTKAKEIHGDKYDYSLAKYQGCKTKLCIICPVHGQFWQQPDHHLNQGNGCRLCGIVTTADKRRCDHDDFISRCREVHGDKYDYTSTKYHAATEEVIITCREHGEFKQQPQVHLRGCGCPHCGAARGAEKQTYDAATFISLARQVHGDKYDYSKVVYTKSQEKVTIICPKHGEFSQAPNKHLSQRGCPDCGTERTADKRRKTQQEFVDEATAKHHGKYSYEKSVYKGDTQPLTIICSKHGEFQQTPSNHLRGKGCVYCVWDEFRACVRRQNFGKLSGLKQTFTKEEFVGYAKKVHGDKYDYSKVVYVRSQDKVTIVCPVHGDFQQRGNGHLRGKGCPQCGAIKRGLKKRFGLQKFLVKARQVHGNKYDYSLVKYKTMHHKVVILCPKHGAFWQEPNSHLRAGCGCPRCTETQGERKVRVWLEKQVVTFNTEYKVVTAHGRRYFDFYLPNKNLMIEFHGGQHYFPCTFGSRKPQLPMVNLRKSVSRDRDKKKWCRENGVELLVIPYWQEDVLDRVLDTFFQTGKRIVTAPPQKVLDYADMRRKFIRSLVEEEQRASPTRSVA